MDIKLAIIGVGNCSCSLIQGINYYRSNCNNSNGLIYWNIGGYIPHDIDVVAAYDIDTRKVGKDVSKAIFSKPNCTKRFISDVSYNNVKVKMGKVLDGFPDHFSNYPDDEKYIIRKSIQPTKKEIVEYLKECKADVIINYLPVGAEKATKFYAECALDANVAYVNCIPVFIASDKAWSKRFYDKNIPIIGDDIKSQLGPFFFMRMACKSTTLLRA